jgi:hypothetical protein
VEEVSRTVIAKVGDEHGLIRRVGVADNSAAEMGSAIWMKSKRLGDYSVDSARET